MITMGGVNDISIVPSRAKRKGEPLTDEEQFTLRSELRELMRIARIARPGALCDASASAQTFGTIGESIVNPMDFEEVADVDIVSKVIEAES